MDKKFVMGIAAMAALTLVSCSSDDLDSFSDNSSKNEAISFDGYLGRSAVAVNGTRGSVVTIDELQKSSEGFGVFGNYSSKDNTETAYGENLFKNEQVTYGKTPNPAEWTYTKTKYWPTEGHIDFLAYAPYDGNQKLIENSKLKFNVTGQKDLLWAKAEKQTMKNNSGAKKVEFTFRHALSRLGYSVKLKKKCSSDATITLKKIILAGSATEPTVGSATESGAFYTNGTIDLSTGNWNPLSDKQYFNWYSAETPGTQTVAFTSTSDETYTSTDYLFVIPQDFSETATDKLYVIVEYDIKYNGISETLTNTVHQQIKQKFVQGKAYMINLTIGRPIEFNAEVTPWTKSPDNEITNIPIDSWE